MACAQGSKALLPVASLWASLDYKSVANWPIMVSRILLLTKLISEINSEIRFQESSLLGKDTSYYTSLIHQLHVKLMPSDTFCDKNHQ